MRLSGGPQPIDTASRPSVTCDVCLDCLLAAVQGERHPGGFARARAGLRACGHGRSGRARTQRHSPSTQGGQQEGAEDDSSSTMPSQDSSWGPIASAVAIATIGSGHTQPPAPRDEAAGRVPSKLLGAVRRLSRVPHASSCPTRGPGTSARLRLALASPTEGWITRKVRRTRCQDAVPVCAWAAGRTCGVREHHCHGAAQLRGRQLLAQHAHFQGHAVQRGVLLLHAGAGAGVCRGFRPLVMP